MELQDKHRPHHERGNQHFAEDWLNAGSLSRDADGAYLVDSIDYIIDYVDDAINGCNPDFVGKLDADLWVM